MLLHGIEKAVLYNLEPLANLKINKSKMLEIAKQRGNKNGKWHEQLTIYNWESITYADIYDTFEEIEQKIQTLRNKLNS